MSWDPYINQDNFFKIEIEQHIYSSFQVREKKNTKYSSRCLERERAAPIHPSIYIQHYRRIGNVPAGIRQRTVMFTVDL